MSEITRGKVWFRVGAPRLLSGVATRGYAIRTGVLLPPAAGPGRAVALEAEGRRLLAQARRGYGTIVRTALFASGSPVPLPVNLDRPWSPGACRTLIAARRDQWEETRRMLTAPAARSTLSCLVRPGETTATVLARLEEEAQSALGAAVAAFDHLEDTDLAGESHYWAHAIGEMVAGLFGCKAKREGDKWFDVCRLSLMHLRIGMSVGFVARRLCSVCGRDVSSFPPCGHKHGVEYPVISTRRNDGSCNICSNDKCLIHDVGETYPVMAYAQVRDIDRLDEISAVPRPRDPLARYMEIEIPARDVQHLVNHDAQDAELYCERCVVPCTGFTSAEEALRFLFVSARLTLRFGVGGSALLRCRVRHIESRCRRSSCGCG
jgi:hypothetical protein